MLITEFNKKWYYDSYQKKVSYDSIVSYFGDKFNMLPEAYIDMLLNYCGMANDSFLTTIYSLIGYLLQVGENEQSIGSELKLYESFEGSKQYNIIPFSIQSSHYEWCFDFDNLKKGQPTISLHSWQGGFCHCIDKDGKEICIDTNEVEDEFGVVVNTNLTFDEFISKLKCEED